jgi:hypothetical protein
VHEANPFAPVLNGFQDVLAPPPEADQRGIA